jgi:hypothetical protein
MTSYNMYVLFQDLSLGQIQQQWFEIYKCNIQSGCFLYVQFLEECHYGDKIISPKAKNLSH